jgi:hypothetical protein
MEATATKEINGAPSALGSEGNTGTVFCQQENKNVCTDENGYRFIPRLIPDWKNPGKKICSRELVGKLTDKPFTFRVPAPDCASCQTLTGCGVKGARA